MTTKVFENVRSFPNSAALAQGTRVKMSAGVLAAAAATDREIGVMENRAFSTDAVGSVRLLSSAVTLRCIAAGAITQYTDVYRAASGKISATASGVPFGMALEAASGDGSLIEILPYRQEVNDVLGVGANYKIARGQLTTASAADTVVTGLATVVAVVACYDDSPADANDFVSATIGDQAGTPAAGSVIIKTWKTADGADVTPTAATSFGKKVNWIAIGT
jgi:hypothetical protein